jgi:LacI family transcriptional regulator
LKRPRIKDIAAKAGVSVGTVDRVLHQRGDVSEQSRQKVQAAMEELGYEVNLLASTLAYNRVHVVGVLLPFPDDAYWGLLYEGVARAARQLKDFSIELRIQHFELSNPRHFAECAHQLLEHTPAAFLFPPLFEQESLELCRLLQAQAIPYVMVNTRLANVNAVSFVGQDAYQAGYLAAGLLQGHLQPGESILVLHLTTHLKEALHYQAKEEGCRAYFDQQGCRPEKVRAVHLPDYRNHQSLGQQVAALLRSQPTGGIVVTSSRAHHLVEAWPKLPRLPILGFDPIPANTHWLKAGHLQYLINQHPRAQGFLGAMLMLDQLIRKQAIPPVRYLPLEIVVRENLDYLSTDLLLV